MNTGLPNSVMPHGGVSLVLDAMEAFSGMTRDVERRMLAELRQSVGWMPLLNLGLIFAEGASRQRRAVERSVILEVRKSISPWHDKVQESECAGFSETGRATAKPHWQSKSTRTDSAVPVPALRLKVSEGARNVTVPLSLRNHRTEIDLVRVSLGAPLADKTAFPAESIHFEPEMLTIPPQENGTVNVLISLDGQFGRGDEYWCEIVVAGTETKRIPLVLEIQAATPMTQETPTTDAALDTEPDIEPSD